MSDESIESRLSRLEGHPRLQDDHGKSAIRPRADRLLACLMLLLIMSCLFVQWRIWHESRAAIADDSLERMFWLLSHDGATDEQRLRAFQKLVAAGNDEWRSARLTNLELKGIDLVDKPLSFARFEGSDLSLSDLTGADLTRCEFDGVVLKGAILKKAIFFETDLLKVDFSEANCEQASFQGAYLGQTRGHDARLFLADLTGANMTLADLKGADLRFANLTGANLSVADLSQTNLFRANLTEAILERANLQDSNWWRATGLSEDTIAQLMVDCIPSDQADAEIREDFELWLSGKSQSEPQEGDAKVPE